MKELQNIRIRTGSNISSILQSTVTLPQAFTELVKNSIQNLSTFVKIDILDDKILIEDDGRGFSVSKDDSGMTDFDKYFVFGNSYDNTGGVGMRLGHMGIGGKLSNDKLSKNNSPDWSIHTKNSQGSCFTVNYKPEKNEFLDDYYPELIEVENEECIVSSDTGTVVVINSINESLKDSGTLYKIEVELKTFFGFLVSKLKSENKKFSITLNGKSLDFDYVLPGTAFRTINKRFYYEIDEEVRVSEVQFNLSLVKTRSLLDKHPVKNVEIISNVKICNLSLGDPELLQHTYEVLSKKHGEIIEIESEVVNLFRNLVGFVSCSDLSSVMDEGGMPAKDLSHHQLREDHPMTAPFMEKVYEVIVDVLRTYLNIRYKSRYEKFDEIVEEITSFLKNSNDIDEKFLVKADLGVDSTKDIVENDIINSAQSAANNKREFDPRSKKHEDSSNWETRVDSEKKEELKDKPLVNFEGKSLINYEVVDFGEGFSREMSRFNDIGELKVLINSTNIKFIRIDESVNPLLMAMHIAECIIMEVAEYNNPMITPKQIQDKISSFYEKSYNSLKDRFLD